MVAWVRLAGVWWCLRRILCAAGRTEKSDRRHGARSRCQSIHNAQRLARRALHLHQLDAPSRTLGDLVGSGLQESLRHVHVAMASDMRLLWLRGAANLGPKVLEPNAAYDTTIKKRLWDAQHRDNQKQ